MRAARSSRRGRKSRRFAIEGVLIVADSATLREEGGSLRNWLSRLRAIFCGSNSMRVP
jgi:hypothetical protein